MATTTGNDSLSEASAIDDMCQAPTTPIARNSNSRFAHVEIIALNREIETFRTQLELAQFADIARGKQRASDNAKRIENLVLATRELEALIIKRDGELVEKRVSLMHHMNVARDAESRAESLQMSIFELEERIAGYERDMSGTVKELEDARDSNARKDEHIADLQSSLAMMTKMASEAAKDATVAREADAPVAAFTHIWCDQEIHEHKARADGLEGRVAALESSLADSQLALKIMSEVGTSASSDAERYMDDARELSEMLTESTKREDRMHETLMGIRALAESNGLTDAEKVALILRLA